MERVSDIYKNEKGNIYIYIFTNLVSTLSSLLTPPLNPGSATVGQYNIYIHASFISFFFDRAFENIFYQFWHHP